MIGTGEQKPQREKGRDPLGRLPQSPSYVTATKWLWVRLVTVEPFFAAREKPGASQEITARRWNLKRCSSYLRLHDVQNPGFWVPVKSRTPVPTA